MRSGAELLGRVQAEDLVRGGVRKPAEPLPERARRTKVGEALGLKELLLLLFIIPVICTLSQQNASPGLPTFRFT